MLHDINVEQDLSADNLKQLQIICAALFMGVFIFLIIVVVLYYLKESPISIIPESKSTELLLYLCLLFSPVTILLSNFVAKNNLKQITGEQTKVSNVTDLIHALTSYYVIKFAMLEGGALFGGVVLILGITSGSIYMNEMIWLAIIPILVFFAIVVIEFPTKIKIIEIYKRLYSNQLL